MNRDEYEKMHAVEGQMWWYRALHANLLSLCESRIAKRESGLLLDAGCGTGGFLERLKRRCPEWRRIGLDYEEIAADLTRQKSGAAACCGSLNQLPFKSGTIDLIVSADVLCHRSIDETAALEEFRRCLAAGGALILNLPAYQWMMSAHDRAVHTSRRYTANGIKTRLKALGFAEVKAVYWNSLLFPLMVARRKLFARDGEQSDVMPYPAVVEFFFRFMTNCETMLRRWGLALPFGGSVLVIAVK